MESDKIYSNRIDEKTLYWYIVIFVLVIYIFTFINVTISLIFGTIIGMVIIIYMYSNYQILKKQELELFEQKRESITPNIQQNEIIKYNEIVDFIFSIQDFYEYNQQAYEDLLESIDHFFILYDEINIDNSLSGINYDMMETKMKTALNTLSSIVIELPKNKKYDNKLLKSVNMLKYLLEKYLNKVKEINNKYIYENGYTSVTKIIETGPPARNYYMDDNFSVL